MALRPSAQNGLAHAARDRFPGAKPLLDPLGTLHPVEALGNPEVVGDASIDLAGARRKGEDRQQDEQKRKMRRRHPERMPREAERVHPAKHGTAGNDKGLDPREIQALDFLAEFLVGTAGFELATPCTPCKCATRLRYAPKR